ncbi:thermonuclease family protein [Rhodobacteraceae bacterium N5(2021)]|uniref:Thermonuclease family protein n=1 Tax=Gymnodinialimonas phycosphaerae TaxID=2841589 RepID=A0A975TZG1_9RHOB|nr:thermonuclease family protein [Gymnodinialimonas phycosphaerae]
MVIYFLLDRGSKKSPPPSDHVPSDHRARKPTFHHAPTPTPSQAKRPTPRAPTARHDHFSEKTATPVPQPTFLKGKAYIVDGDTLRIQKTQIRLFGVDALEMNHPFGKKAKWAMFELCKNQIVTAEITEIDDHGRTVAKCTLSDGRDLSAELVKQGLALDWAKYSGGIYRAMETPDARKKLWLADARQKGRMHVWEAFDAKKRAKAAGGST